MPYCVDSKSLGQGGDRETNSHSDTASDKGSTSAMENNWRKDCTPVITLQNKWLDEGNWTPPDGLLHMTNLER